MLKQKMMFCTGAVLLLAVALFTNGSLYAYTTEKNNEIKENKIVASYITSHYNIDTDKASKIALSITSKCKEKNIPTSIIIGIVEVESKFKHKASSGRGDEGLMQIRYSVWKKKYRISSRKALHDINRNIDVGTDIFRYYLKRNKGNVREALYNYSGGLKVRKSSYVKKVLKKAVKYTTWYQNEQRYKNNDRNRRIQRKDQPIRGISAGWYEVCLL